MRDEYKRALRAEVTRAADGVVEVFMPLFESIDSFGTGWRPGVFDRWLSENKPKVVGWDHNSGERFGVVADWRREETGYRFFAQFNLATVSGSQAYETIRFDLENGAPDEWSFRFEPVETEMQDGIPFFVEAKVYEISPVLVGAVPNTTTVGARSATAEAAPAAFTIEEATALVEMLSDRLRIGKKLQGKKLEDLRTALGTIRDAVGAIEEIVTWASDGATESAPEGDERQGPEDPEDEENDDGSAPGESQDEGEAGDDEEARAALAILAGFGESRLAKGV